MTNKTILILSIATTIILGGIIIASTTFGTAQASVQTSTNNAITGSGLPCNTSPTRGISLTIDGVTGLDGKQCMFEIKDFSFGVENPTTIGSATGGAGAGKIKFNEFTIKKTSDSASPFFFLHAGNGAHFNNVTIQMRKAGGDPSSAGKPFLTYQFGTVFTTKIDWSGPGDEGPEESITFVYGQLSVQYQPQKSDSPAVIGCWDIIQNAICQQIVVPS
jgi:type VI secretion system secreted protein Hcp